MGQDSSGFYLNTTRKYYDLCRNPYKFSLNLHDSRTYNLSVCNIYTVIHPVQDVEEHWSVACLLHRSTTAWACIVFTVKILLCRINRNIPHCFQVSLHIYKNFSWKLILLKPFKCYLQVCELP
jgi:hypothetical protein